MRRPRARARGTRGEGEAVPRPYGSEDVLVGAGLNPAPTSAERKRHAGLHPRERPPPGLRKHNPGYGSATDRLRSPRILDIERSCGTGRRQVLLERPPLSPNMGAMKTKAATSAKRTAVAKKKAARKVAKGLSAKLGHRPAYQVVAKTYDGVSILRPKTKPTHFTSKQIRETIIEVKNASD